MQLVRKRVLKFILKHKLILPGDSVVVAVSGGADSVALLDILANLPGFPLKLVIAHLNHTLRGDESDGDEHFVRTLAAGKNLPCEVLKLDIKTHACEQGLSLEEAGRNARRSFLKEVAGKYSAAAVALGHHRDDQAETVLMRLIRGSAASGLLGIRPKSSEGDFIRPLLVLSRDEINEYLNKGAILFREDRSNTDVRFLRNRIRHELLPLLRDYNPEIAELLNRTSDAIAADEEFLGGIVDAVYSRVSCLSDGQLTIDVDSLKREKMALRKRVYRRAIFELKGDLKRVSATHLDDIDTMVLATKGSGSIALPDSLSVERAYGFIVFREGAGEVVGPIQEVTIESCGIYRLSTGAVISLEEVSGVPAFSSLDRYMLYVDIAKLPFPWTVRSSIEGDRFTPLGMQGRKKLKSLFVDKKVPAAKRKCVPLFLQGDEIFWVGGLQSAEITRISSSPGRMLSLSLHHIVLS